MLKMIGVSFLLALQNIRANFFHTVLSVLGIVIGVAALVAILSFIDGIEVYAKKQISSTTSLHSIVVRTNTHKWIDGIQVENKSPGYFTLEKLQALETSLSHPAESFIFLNRPQEFFLADSGKQVGVMVTGVNAAMAPQLTVKAGRLFQEDEVAQGSEVTVLNEKLARLITRQEDLSAALGRRVVLEGRSLRVIGVVESEDEDKARAAIPITLLDEAAFVGAPPTVIFEVVDVEHVTALKLEIENWLETNLARGEGNFVVVTHQFRLQQLEQGFLIFKIVMGLITGIAVLVGGIGIMNVLLISVNERTVEIGVRKATGAKKRDILLQFLSESVTVSSFGSLLGVVVGVLGTLLAVPVVQHYAKAPFEASFTISTMLFISIMAIVMGVIFGTYPAMRAASLDPVEAIRRE